MQRLSPEERRIQEAARRAADAGRPYIPTSLTIWQMSEGKTFWRVRCLGGAPTDDASVRDYPPLRVAAATREEAEAWYRRDQRIPDIVHVYAIEEH